MMQPAHRWTGFCRSALVAVMLCWPCVAWANPVSINGISLIAFGIVAFWALVVEAGVVALMLLFAGMAPLRTMGGYLVTNVAVFVFLFFPMTQRESAPLWLLEVGVVWLDASAIRMLSRKPYFQGDDYKEVSWRQAAKSRLTSPPSSRSARGRRTSRRPGWSTRRRPVPRMLSPRPVRVETPVRKVNRCGPRGGVARGNPRRAVRRAGVTRP